MNKKMKMKMNMKKICNKKYQIYINGIYNYEVCC